MTIMIRTREKKLWGETSMEAPCEVTRVVRAAYSTKKHHRARSSCFIL